MKKILIFALPALFLAGCNSVPKLKEGLIFPEVISPIYYLDTFHIPSPIVAIIDSVPYILPETALEHFENADDLRQRKDVVNYLTYRLAFWSSSDYYRVYRSPGSQSYSFLQYDNEFYYQDIIHFVDSIRGIPVYKFDFKPQTFLLTLIASKATPVMALDSRTNEPMDDVIEKVLYSKDYILAIAPIFNKKDNKELKRRYVEKYLKD